MATDALTAAGGWWPYLFILVAGFAATNAWRILGVVAATRVDEHSETLRWVRAVSTALVAGLVARLVVFPVGVLELAPLAVRLAAVGIGIAAYLAISRNVFVGILAGEAALLAGIWMFRG